MHRRLRIALLLGIAAATAASLRAEEGGKLVTDPALLTWMGFAADARNVYRVEPEVRPSPAAPETFGSAFGSTMVLGNQHNARESSTYDTINGFGDIYLVSGGLFYDALLDMPHGARLEGLHWSGFDDSVADMSFFLIRGCTLGGGLPTLTVLFTITTAFVAGGEFIIDLPPDEDVTVDNRACAYVARTRFGAATSNLRLRRFRATWRRQVSDAPLVATFPNDVPTTHPYFRFIEALAASGITAGCAPGSYCPQNPITRGEMAVFVAVALGLHWP